MASTSPSTALSGRSAVGAGTAVDMTDARARVTMVVTQSGGVTGGLVTMEASQDNTNWVIVHTFDMGIRAAQFYSMTNGAFRYWRGNVVSAITGGGTVSATFMEADR